MAMDPKHWLYERGLESTVNKAPLDPYADAPLIPTLLVDPALPVDYVARVEALRAALKWQEMQSIEDQDRTLQRALDFHAFLMGREQKEPTHTDD